jgi:hypothetical protein
MSSTNGRYALHMEIVFVLGMKRTEREASISAIVDAIEGLRGGEDCRG